MKQIISTLAILVIIATVNSANAQDKSLAFNSPAFKAYETTTDKANYAATNEGAVNMRALRDGAVNMRALRDFIKSFKNATDVKWYAIEDGFIAKFKENEIETKVVYNQNGNWHCNLRTYNEHQLPFDVRDLVKRKYYDFNILVVYEITHKDNVTYILKIDDSKTLKTLRITDGEMDVIADNIKG